LLYFTENALTESELCIGYYVLPEFLGGNFVSSLICTRKYKKPKKPFKPIKKPQKPNNFF